MNNSSSFAQWFQKLSDRRCASKPRRNAQAAGHGALDSIQSLEARSLLTTFVVNSLADTVDINPGDGLAEDASGNTTLRAALHEANSLAGPDEIQLPAGTYELLLTGVGEDGGLTGDLDFLDDVTLQGNSAGDTILDANDLDRIIHVLSGVNVTIRDVTIEDGSNLFSSSDGAGVRNEGTLTIQDSLITNHISAGGGGAIVNESSATLILSNTRVEDSVSVGNRGGGGILNRGVVTLQNSVFRTNVSTTEGGAIVNLAGATLISDGSEFNNNRSGSGRDGGAIFNAATATIEQSLFVSNSGNDGGAISNNGGGQGNLLVVNSTFSGNGASSDGGAIYNASNDTSTVLDSTFTGNQTASNGGAIRNQGGTLNIGGSIVFGNQAALSGNDLSGGITSTDYNLVGDSAGAGPYEIHDFLNVDPLLDTLADNGGPTKTHALLPGSPAVDANPQPARFIDQRRAARPVDGNNDGTAEADIGAYEVQNFEFTADSALEMTLLLNNTHLEIVDSVSLEILLSEVFDPAGSVVIDGSSGDDVLTVDFSGGNPVPHFGVTFSAGTHTAVGDRLNLMSDGFTTIAHDFATSNAGQVELIEGADTSVISYTDVENSADDLNAINRVFNFGPSDDTVTVSDGTLESDERTRVSSSSSLTLDFFAPSGETTFNTGAGEDTLLLSSVDSFLGVPLFLNGQDGDDQIDASSLSIGVTLDGASGDDVLTGGSAADSALGGAGSDTIVTGAGNDTLLGGSQRDRLDGGEGDDFVLGQGAKRDTVTGGLGNDFINGGGADVLIEIGDADLTLTDSTLTGLGSDTVRGITIATLVGGASDNMIDTSAFTGYAAIIGEGGNDHLIGGHGPTVILGGAGNDVLVGNDGDDTLLGSAGKDRLEGGNGNDRLRGQGASNDSLIGGAGDDFLDGGRGGDILLETADSDFTLTATSLTGNGNDTVANVERVRLVGGAGDNVIDASAFPGRVIAFGVDGNDTLIGSVGPDLLAGGAGNDVIKGRDGDDHLLGEDGDDILNGGAGDDELVGGAGNDGLSGWTGNDRLEGDEGTDTAYGGAGHDNIFGGPQSDILQGGAGDDLLEGNAGPDILTGGTGNGTSDNGDVLVGSITEIDEFFNLDPIPAWIDEI